MYEIKSELTFTQCGADGRLKLHEAVAMMTDCCQFQEHQESALKKYLLDNGIAIFLSSIQIDVFRLPLFRENICGKSGAISSIPAFCVWTRNSAPQVKD